MQSQVDDVKSRVNIVDLVGEYVRLQKAGINWKAPCPFHQEKTPSFFVNEEKQMFHCFGCGKGGDVFAFLMEIEGLEFREALRMLAEKTGVKLEDFQPEVASQKNALKEILELSTKFFEKQLWDGVGKKQALPYFFERGLQEGVMRRFRLGYAPQGWRNLLDFLVGRGYQLADIERAGMIIKKADGIGTSNAQAFYDRFRDRIIFPVRTPMGEVIGFSARVLPGQDEKQAKYINTPETPLYRKSKVLYGIENAKRKIKEQNWVLIVEGNMDVIAASQVGIANVVAVSGTALTGDHLEILGRYTDTVKLFFDMDSAGKEAARKSAFLALDRGMNVQVVTIKNGKDAADLAKSNPAELIAAVDGAKEAIEYFFQDVFSRHSADSAQDKKKISQELVECIAHLTHPVERQHWEKDLAHRLGVTESVITDAVNASLSDRNNQPEQQGKVSRGEVQSDMRDRVEVLREKVAAVLITQPTVWMKVAGGELESQEVFQSKKDLLDQILKNAKTMEYDARNADRLNDSELGKKIRALYFQSLATLSHDQGTAMTVGEALEVVREYLIDLKKETIKEKLKTIDLDIKKAEAANDRQAKSALMQEFMQLTREIHNLE